MPFRSKRQARYFFASEDRGDLPKGTAKEWAAETPNIKKLPEKVRKKKASEIADEILFKLSAANITDQDSSTKSIYEDSLKASQPMQVKPVKPPKQPEGVKMPKVKAPSVEKPKVAASKLRSLVKMRKYVDPIGVSKWESTLPPEIAKAFKESLPRRRQALQEMLPAAKAPLARRERELAKITNPQERLVRLKELLKEHEMYARELPGSRGAAPPLLHGLRSVKDVAHGLKKGLKTSPTTTMKVTGKRVWGGLTGERPGPKGSFNLAKRKSDIVGSSKMHREGQSSTTELHEALQGFRLGPKHYGEVIRRQPLARMESDNVFVSPWAQKTLERMGRGKNVTFTKNPEAYTSRRNPLNLLLGRKGLSTLPSEKGVYSIAFPPQAAIKG